MSNNRKITYCRFHTKLFVPGVGEIGDVLPSPNKTFRSLNLSKQGDGVYVEVNGFELWIPSANIVLTQFAKEEPTQNFSKSAA